MPEAMSSSSASSARRTAPRRIRPRPGRRPRAYPGGGEGSRIRRLRPRPGGVRLDLAGKPARRRHAADVTERLGLMIAHRPGFTQPTLAARQLATLDQLTGGRVAVHIITGGTDGRWSRTATS